MRLAGTADSAPIQLHAARVRRRVRDVVILTTTYGRTIAIDPGTGAKLWQFVPSDIRSYEGSFRITNAGPSLRSSRHKNIRQISRGAKACISVIARHATVPEAWGMDRTRRISRWHRPTFTAFRPSLNPTRNC